MVGPPVTPARTAARDVDHEISVEARASSAPAEEHYMRRSRSRCRTIKPCLLALEDRFLPSTVTNLNDSGPGSLRQALTITPANGQIDFQPGLSGTIQLTSGPLNITQNVNI